MDTSDVATLNDALGSAGVDLRVRCYWQGIGFGSNYSVGRGGKPAEVP